MLILQNFTNSPKILGVLCSEKSATLLSDVHGSVGIAVGATDMDIMVEEMSVVKVEEDGFMDIKGEEILKDTTEEDFHGDVTAHTVKAEQDKVSHIFSIIRHVMYIRQCAPSFVLSLSVSVSFNK
jgi:hypothetical protein